MSAVFTKEFSLSPPRLAGLVLKCDSLNIESKVHDEALSSVLRTVSNRIMNHDSSYVSFTFITDSGRRLFLAITDRLLGRRS